MRLKIINKRLIEFLENTEVFTNIQCGFRRRSSYYGSSFKIGLGLHMFIISVLFDPENAYATTLRHGIVKDLYGYCGLRGRLPNYVTDFLQDQQKSLVFWQKLLL